jgi:tetratricopeptide (TPR) repeat protein
MKKVVCNLALLLLLVSGQAAAQSLTKQPSNDAKLRYAAAQHEIITILINEGEYERVPAEFQKILDLGFSGTQEALVVKEAWAIVTGLMANRQFESAHRVVDEALRKTVRNDSRFALIMLKGKIFKQEGRLKDALNAYRQAQQLQEE